MSIVLITSKTQSLEARHIQVGDVLLLTAGSIVTRHKVVTLEDGYGNFASFGCECLRWSKQEQRMTTVSSVKMFLPKTMVKVFRKGTMVVDRGKVISNA